MTQKPILKISNVKDAPSIKAAMNTDADFVEFVFHARAARYCPPETAAILMKLLPSHMRTVGVFIDDSDEWIDSILSQLPLDTVHIAGQEDAMRAHDIKAITGVPLIKSFLISKTEDLSKIDRYKGVIDYAQISGRPAHNVLTTAPDTMDRFHLDPALVVQADIPVPWFLAGALTLDNMPKDSQIAKRIAVSL